jgi:hypothetical protein
MKTNAKKNITTSVITRNQKSDNLILFSPYDRFYLQITFI